MQKFYKHKISLFTLLLAAPFSALAATIGTIISKIIDILTLIIPLLMVIATIVFIWGVISYILAVGSDERKKEAKNLIIWGLIGLFVIVAIWGLIRVIKETFGVPTEPIPVTGPQLRGTAPAGTAGPAGVAPSPLPAGGGTPQNTWPPR